MATPQRMKDMLRAQPFRPFTVGLVGGRRFLVKHPEYAAVSVDGREMTIYDDDGAHYIEGLMIDVIETAPMPAQAGPEDNGG